MVGIIKISTDGVTLREEQSPYFRSSKGIALVATPVNAGSQSKRGRRRQIVAPSCLTYLAPATSLRRLLAKIYIAMKTGDLVSVEVVVTSVQYMNHLMVKAIADHRRIKMVTIFL